VPISIREILELEIFQHAAPRVVAGADHLDRQVRWVHVSELPDIAHLLEGGELLLTTGMGFSQDPDLQRRYIEELVNVGVAGLTIELGRNLPNVPTAMIQRAEELGFPVIALTHETRYVDVTKEVHTAIVNRQYQLLQRAETIGRRFTDLASSGADLKLLLESLASLLKNPVVFEDLAHQVVEFATHAAPVDETLRCWESHSRAGHDDQGQRGIVHFADGHPPCAWIGIWLRGEFWGRLHVLQVDSEPDELVSLVLDRAAATIGLTLLAQRDASQLADRARGHLITDIIKGRYTSPGELYRRARSLSVDLKGKRLGVMVVDIPRLPELAEARGLSEHDRQRIRQAAMREVRRSIARAQAVGLTGLEGDRIVALVGLPGRRDPRPVLEAIGSDAVTAIGVTEALEAVAGISRETRIDALPLAFEEAGEAARYAWRVGRRPGIQHYDDLGLHQLLLPLSDRPELSRFVESELGSLLAHDARSSSPLLPTLRAYLAHSGNKAEATRDLHIERRTLYRRLERLERVLGRELSNHETRIRLTVALYGLDLLRQKANPRTLLERQR
jgi:purine catabolism regulator